LRENCLQKNVVEGKEEGREDEEEYVSRSLMTLKEKIRYGNIERGTCK